MQYYLDKGYRVVALVPKDEKFSREIPKGLELVYAPLSRASMNLVKDRVYIRQLIQLLKQKPAHVFSYTIKPNIFCACLCKFYGVSLTAMVPGLGYVSNSGSITAKLGKWLYRASLKRCKSIFVLNEANANVLIEDFKLNKDRIKLLKGGEGVDLDAFKSNCFPQKEEVVFLMIGRVLADKGYREYVNAAKHVKKQFPNVEFQLLGYIDEENPEAIPRLEIDRDVSAGAINYLGYVNDVVPIIEKAHCIVLPSSYGEGLNRSLMEATALGRIIICSNISGCKETVDDGVNGFLVEPKNSEYLAKAMLKVIRMPQEERMRMSAASRAKAEREFGMDRVYEMYNKELNHD